MREREIDESRVTWYCSGFPLWVLPMSEATGLLFAALALIAVSVLFRRVLLSPKHTDKVVSDPALCAEEVPLNILYSESKLIQNAERAQIRSVELCPWQFEVATEISRLMEPKAKAKAKQEQVTATVIKEIPPPVEVFTRTM